MARPACQHPQQNDSSNHGVACQSKLVQTPCPSRRWKLTGGWRGSPPRRVTRQPMRCRPDPTQPSKHSAATALPNCKGGEQPEVMKSQTDCGGRRR
eukprot:12526828-Alexandrium_andersonii.AAC.1